MSRRNDIIKQQWYVSVQMNSDTAPTYRQIYTPFQLDSAKKINKKIVKAHSATDDRISKSRAIIKSSSQKGPYNLLHELRKRAQTTDSTINFFNIVPNHFSTTMVRTSNQENLRMRKQQYLWARCQIPVGPSTYRWQIPFIHSTRFITTRNFHVYVVAVKLLPPCGAFKYVEATCVFDNCAGTLSEIFTSTLTAIGSINFSSKIHLICKYTFAETKRGESAHGLQLVYNGHPRDLRNLLLNTGSLKILTGRSQMSILRAYHIQHIKAYSKRTIFCVRDFVLYFSTLRTSGKGWRY